jgi:uncharacterized protein YcfL
MCQITYKLQLLVGCEAADDGLQNTSDSDLVYPDKAAVVNISEDAHEELAVHSVGHSTVARNTVTEVLDVESALETRREEPSEWSHK